MRLKIFNPVTETMQREALQAAQWHKIKRLITHAYANSEFYRDRMTEANLHPDDITSIEDYTGRMPFVTKQDFLRDQDAAPPYGKRLAVPTQQIANAYLTSGTSGQGQEVHAYTSIENVDSIDSWERSFYWAGVLPGDTGYLMMPVGVTAGPYALLTAFQHYPLQSFLVGMMEGDARLAMMKRFPPHFICTGPVYLRRLTVICNELGIVPRRDFPQMKAIKLGSFSFEVGWAREMEEFWGAKVLDTYASTAAGSGIAATCEQGTYWPDGRRGIMHFPEDKIFVEVLNPETDQHVQDGEAGELVLTPLHRFAMPILRLRTRDRVVFRRHDACPCGRQLVGIEAGAVSRYDAMLKIRGMNLWPEAVDALVFGHDEIGEYNGAISVNDIGREVATVTVEFKNTCALSRAERHALLSVIKTEIKEKTSVSMEVTEGMVEKFVYKEKRWKDLRSKSM